MADIQIVNNPDKRRYEARVGDEVVGIAQYVPSPERLIFTHTEVDSNVEGRGIGSRLAKGALDDVRQRGLRATLHCPFLSAYARRHPEYADIIDARRPKAERQKGE